MAVQGSASNKKIVMSWSKCKVEVAETPDDEAMPSSLTSVGTINDKSTTLATEDGETLTATASGGVVVAEEEGEPTVTITTRVKEMDFDKEKMFTGAEISSDGDELTVKSNVVGKDFAVKSLLRISVLSVSRHVEPMYRLDQALLRKRVRMLI